MKKCIINVGIGGWYAKGSERLRRSLIYHGYDGDFLIWKDDLPPGAPTHESNPYAFKVYAFREAVRQGYTHILWLDCSAWCIKDPTPIFNRMTDEGYYFWSSGYNCAQSTNDNALKSFNITRDEAEKFEELSSGGIGLYISNPQASQFLEYWGDAAEKGCFKGSRFHDNQSRDPRFLFHRQDQCCASIVANKLGMKISRPGEFMSYYDPTKMSKSVIFSYRGM